MNTEGQKGDGHRTWDGHITSRYADGPRLWHENGNHTLCRIDGAWWWVANKVQPWEGGELLHILILPADPGDVVETLIRHWQREHRRAEVAQPALMAIDTLRDALAKPRRGGE